MKLDFSLTGKGWFGLYLLFLILYIGPSIVMQFVSRRIKADPHDTTTLLVFFALFIIMILAILILAIPILKKFIQQLKFNNNPFLFHGRIGQFVLLNIGNILLSIITLGIYFPWYIKNLTKYIAGNTEYNGSKLSFNGKGLNLLGILVLTMLVPLVLWLVVVLSFFKGINTNGVELVLGTIVLALLMVPYIYYIYRWAVNISYKEYLVKWNTKALPAIMIILREMVFTVITVGIYFPFAYAKLYEFFMNNTVIQQDGKTRYSFKAKLDYWKMWRVMWGQVLLTIVTCGIYGAWAYCNIMKLFINSTIVE